MNLSDDQKADILRFLDSHAFLHAAQQVAVKASEMVDLGRPAPDLGMQMALEKGINMFPQLLRELILPNNTKNQAPLAPPTLKLNKP